MNVGLGFRCLHCVVQVPWIYHFCCFEGSQLPDTCDLVTKTSERTALNLQQLLLSTASQPDSDFQIRLFHILSHCEIKQGFHSEENVQELKMSVMIITACDIILTQDSLIWLQPESTQTPLISTTQQISNIVEVVRRFSFVRWKRPIPALFDASLLSSALPFEKPWFKWVWRNGVLIYFYFFDRNDQVLELKLISLTNRLVKKNPGLLPQYLRTQ